VDRRERKDILGEWGVRQPNTREAAQARKLAELADGVADGRPIAIRRRNFRPALDSYVASLGGPLPYMVRLREIERLTTVAEAALRERWQELARACGGDADVFRRRWRELVRRFDFGEVNELIERHNRWYPVEARLPMDVRRRDYVLVNGEHYSRRLLDAAWALERFPPELDAASSR
jgi:hypothetical protein